MGRLFVMVLAGTVLAAAAVWAQPGQDLMLELDLAGRPGVPPGVSGQVYLPLPLSRPSEVEPAPPGPSNVLRGTPGDVLRGKKGNVLGGPPGHLLTGSSSAQP